MLMRLFFVSFNSKIIPAFLKLATYNTHILYILFIMYYVFLYYNLCICAHLLFTSESSTISRKLISSCVQMLDDQNIKQKYYTIHAKNIRFYYYINALAINPLVIKAITFTCIIYFCNIPYCHI